MINYMYKMVTMTEHQRIIPGPIRTPLGSILIGGIHKDGYGINRTGKYRSFDGGALVLITKGEGFYRDANGRRPIKTGDAIIVFPGLPHFYGTPKGGAWDEIYVAFDGPLFDCWFKEAILNPRAPIRHLGDRINVSSLWLKTWLEQFVRLSSSTKQVQALTGLLGFFAEIALGEGHTTPVKDAWANHAKGLLSYDLTGEIDLEKVANEMGMSYEAFRKRFQTNTKTSPLRYRNERKIEAAKQLIRYAPQSGNREIADALGFADEFHFSKRFRQLVGVSPNTFRKSLSVKS
jgi:AraC-like DNA-binding protein